MNHRDIFRVDAHIDVRRRERGRGFIVGRGLGFRV
jgi:hypothetical protein